MVVSVQYLRGIASLLVLLQHLAVKGAQYAGDPLKGFLIGGVGVEIFFIISGFIMCHTTHGKERSLYLVFDFIKNRCKRILPLYWILSSVALLLFLLFPAKFNLDGKGETMIIASFFLFPTPGAYLIKNGWTLSYEFLFYFLFSLGLISKSPRSIFISIFLLACLPMMSLVFMPAGIWMHFLTDIIIVNFLFGIAIFYGRFLVRVINPAISVSLIFLGIGLLVLENNGYPSIFPILARGFPAFIFCLGFIYLEPLLKRYYVNIFRSMGDASYSLYLSHPFALAGGSIVLTGLKFDAGRYPTVFLSILFIFAVFIGFLVYSKLELSMTRCLRNL